jgi:lipoic acid synthetase
MSQVQAIMNKPKIRLQIGPNYSSVKNVVRENELHTVCEEARCPNIYECWENGTATLMILGNVCTRACGFCSVKTGKPTWNDPMEPFRTALTVKKMRLRHVVITSVDRDDLKNDYGAEIWAETIYQIRSFSPNCTVEVLTPDFRGYYPALKKVFDSKPEIFSHNLECIKRVSRKVRPQSNWQRSLNVLQYAADYGLRTKTGIMVGLGETKKEVLETMQQAVDLGIEIFTIGQYLQPTKNHLSVDRYVSDNEFLDYKEAGLEIGFKIVESGPLVRSSYHADDQINRLNLDG